MYDNRLKDKKLNEIYKYISSINQVAYKCNYLLANKVLSKQTLSKSKFYDYYFNRTSIVLPSFGQIIKTLIIYYKRSFVGYFKYVRRKIFWIRFGERFPFNTNNRQDLVLIDSFFLVKYLLKKGKFEDSYFEGLNRVLQKRNIKYAYLPVFTNYTSLTEFQDILKLLKNDNIPVLSEYQLLSSFDFFRLIIFIILYPIYVLKLSYSLQGGSYISKVFKNELLNEMGRISFFSFSRFLLGNKISLSSCNNIKLISWYENQSIDKTLYKGLRSNVSTVKIFGCQLLLWSNSNLNYICDPLEIPHGVVPDKILVNGKYYLNIDERINSQEGPSFRYKKIFNFKINFHYRTDFLVILPYFHSEIINILTVLNNIVYYSGKITVKIHPAITIDQYINYIPDNFIISNDNLYDLFKYSKIVLSTNSGSLVEAVTVGIPAIVLNNTKPYSNNPLPSIGKSIVWDYADDSYDVMQLIKKFGFRVNYEKNILIKYANIYKNMFFCEPTEQKIIESFEL